ncbi:uncharacterized protein LTHEOB_4300 [Lasiodiplodia theobromae]|uniref:uncharacterized protein n=1 Tax=Lasiodiplodia theobromae TaxID=45133 RepID=UPI0015C2EE3C|nr:uncharacterized protein LTHEOB_4300 [Lasiodiplodia theobromae]KAF4546303.1 hypothetical protein LTHEOB_4300 [Lasiodiplodia theobromae]
MKSARSQSATASNASWSREGRTPRLVKDRYAMGTRVVESFPFDYSPTHTVYLIDTPGFDDADHTDTDVLREIAAWLTRSYGREHVKLSGLIYVHPITGVRMQGSARRNLHMFYKLCGRDALKKVILVTSMWDKVDVATGVARETELKETPEFWGAMIRDGSTAARYQNDTTSARAVIKKFVERPGRVTTKLQQEMVVEKKDLVDTDAGQAISEELIQERAKTRRIIEEMQEQKRKALTEKDYATAVQMEELRKEQDARLQKIEAERELMKADMEKLYQQRVARLEQQLEEATRMMSSMQVAHNLERQQQYLWTYEPTYGYYPIQSTLQQGEPQPTPVFPVQLPSQESTSEPSFSFSVCGRGNAFLKGKGNPVM